MPASKRSRPIHSSVASARERPAWWFTLTGALVVVAAAVGRYSAPAVAVNPSVPFTESTPSAPAALAARSVAPNTVVMVPSKCPAAADGDEPEDTGEVQRKRARSMLSIVKSQLAGSNALFSTGSVERVVNASSEYMHGITDGLTQGDPELLEAMSEQIEEELCASNPRTDRVGRAQKMALARMLKTTEGLATPEAFECFFRDTTEDVVLWEGLDALRATGLPEPRTVTELGKRTQTPQTKARFMSAAELTAMHEQPPAPPEATQGSWVTSASDLEARLGIKLEPGAAAQWGEPAVLQAP